MKKYVIISAITILICSTSMFAQQTFQNVASSMGIYGQTGLGHGVGWGDIDNDGDNTFTETGVSIGISGEWIGDYFGVDWADYNLDGAVDLFAAGHIDKYQLFKNNNNPGNYLSIYL